MDKKRSDDTKLEEYKFHQNKISISINSIDINKIVVSNMFSFLIKKILNILLGIKMLKKTRHLCILCLEMFIYRRDFDETKCMYFD